MCFFAGDFDGSENDFDDNDNNDFDHSDHKQFGRRHWERADHPVISNVKEEKVYWLYLNAANEKKNNFLMNRLFFSFSPTLKHHRCQNVKLQTMTKIKIKMIY